MIPVIVDISQIAEEFYLTKEEMNSFSTFVIEVIASKFAKQWSEEAKQNLHQSRNEYIRAIYTESVSENTKVVGIAGFLPNAVESGIGAFDQKPWFEKSSKVHLKKGGGWYMTIPFRFATPGTVGDSEVFSGTLPDEIHDILKNKAKAGDTSGLKLGELPDQYKIPNVRGSVTGVIDSSKSLKSKVFDAYTHKSPIHEGIAKSSMEFNSQYTSFRRVSDMSDPDSWIHTGIAAHNLAEAALSKLDIETITDRAIDNFLKTI